MAADVRYEVGRKVSLISLAVNSVLALAKVVVGWLFFSQALLADGFHSVSDIASTIIVLMSIKISQAPPDDRHPYGHGKAESIATKLLGLILVGTGLGLIKSAVTAILSGQNSVPSSLVLWVAGFSILAKEGLYHYTVKIGEKIDSKGLVADAHHHRSDAFSSIAALIGAGGAKLGFPILDPLAGLVVALFILRIGVKILWEAIDDLMDAVPDYDKLDSIKEQVEEISEVIEVGDIRLRNYGHYLYVDLDVVVKDDLTVVEGHKVARKTKEKVKELHAKVSEVMVHVDPESVHREAKRKQEKN
jgi:cation diffusion facilitator family transporter